MVLEGLVGGKQVHSEKRLRNAHEAEGEDHGEYVVEEEEDDVRAAFLSHLDPCDQRHDAEDGEEEELISKRNKINNLEKIISAVREAVEALSGERGALDALREAKRAMSSVSRLDEAYSNACERIESISLDADDVAQTLSDMGDELYFDEDEAQETENRLDAIKALKRKYGADKKEIDAYLLKCREEYELLSDCEGQYAVLTGFVFSFPQTRESR